MNKTAFIYHEHCELHNMGEEHPESPLRTQAIANKLHASGLMKQLIQQQAFSAKKEHILRVHGATYIEQIDRMSPEFGLVKADQETLMGPHTREASYLAAGAGIHAVDGVINGAFDNAFCSVRPPGHHAEPNVTMGFCFFNNIAIAAEHALKHHGLERVAIIDFDVHQCNGTIESFADRPEVMVCTSFQHPFYPNSHWASEHPHILLTPMVAFSDCRDVKHAWQQQWAPALREHQPQMIFISAGFDAHTKDPMSQTNWQSEDFYWLTNEIKALAKELCQGKIVSMLEGGYHLDALAESAELHIKSLLED